jgi:hypothetical protein
MTENNSVDISDIDKDILLEELWKNSISLFDNDTSFNLTIAKSQMKNLYPDYICGRLIKCDIYNSNFVNPYLYDRENGKNSFKQVIETIRYSSSKYYLKKNIEDVLNKKKFDDILSKETSKKLGITNDTFEEAKKLYNDLF